MANEGTRQAGRIPGSTPARDALDVPMARETALALALDLSRRSTPADGGFS
ncbi:hypothetical protein STAFG_2683 [Streptomyces afghaniensis 772]|uniref:Uncharacterized protein n=1 Tax=Streptomyces afghaniensis 772 TaxID=1283301 RepID=S4N110_9ACTN|nr:hypothetical protein STAFG_2683 [Streptomyces afghaniensis 772]